jgi:transcriptional regulator with XRE-family HTH domain
MDVGGRVKKLRQQRRLVIEELAAQTGLSKPYISQIENSKASPSLETLQRLAHAMSVPLTSFLIEEEFACYVVRERDRQIVNFGSGGARRKKRIHFLSAPNRQLEMVLLELPPGYSAGGRDHMHDGEECHLVLEGRIQAVQGDASYILNAGDSYHWDGSVPHHMDNIGDQPARVLIARTPPGFLSTRIYVDGGSIATAPALDLPKPRAVATAKTRARTASSKPATPVAPRKSLAPKGG